MAWTLDDLDQINAAIATGASKVRFSDGREVTNRSLADLRSIRDEIASAIGERPEPVRTSYASHSRD